ncbi:HlyD family type I secretion periplasmic adaptor subunit [Phaeobacter sp. NW0010-22]|uniref:HlyD family type I secretion periplasmic adaptor subunit n=1 Tax=Phaeobacter sp. NW0010-22 TaxID=3135907 RepID=UPI0031058831
MAEPSRQRSTWNTGMPLRLAILSFVMLIIGVMFWSSRVNISGAVIGDGVIEVSTTMTAVQHPIGGVIEDIHAQNGDEVLEGDLLVRLDSRQLRSDLNVVEIELFEVLANIARLQAIIDSRRTLEPPPLLREALRQRPDLERMVVRQQQQLLSYFQALDAGTSLLDEQIEQVRAEIEGVEAQLAAKRDEQEYLKQELVNVQNLATRQLIKLSEVFRLQKAAVTVRGDIGRFSARIAALRGRISELNQKRLAVLPTAQEKAEEAMSKLRPLRTRFLEKRVSLVADLSRLEIRAPINGKIHDSKVLGPQSVVVAAKPLMMIVPDDDPIQVGVRVGAADIDQVFVGQSASLKFTAFSGRDIPIIVGQVERISADVFSNPVTKKFYYEVKVGLLDDEMKKLGQRELLPGMPVEAYLSTESRTPFNYVLRPLKNYFDRAFRDS